MYDLV
ncbi:uncharacterized protein CPUR_01958 [Claviceps purpurea 20.1]